MSRSVCPICPHRCPIEEGGVGFCRARGNAGGKITAINYGFITSIALDPIEKKPLNRFHPGSRILSVGSFGCNLRCPFCQNYGISTARMGDMPARKISPDELAEAAVSLIPDGNIGVAYTYNEPLVGYEYVRDCAAKAKGKSLKNVLVTNGYICEQPLLDLLPLIDAMNIDLKAFTDGFYRKIGGDLETVKNTIRLSAARCHVEVATLVIPGENDGEDEIRSLSRWLKSVRPDIPLHLSRFFPMYRMLDKNPTKTVDLHKLADVARESLQYVYVGNV